MVACTLRGPTLRPPPTATSVLEGFQWAALAHPHKTALIDAQTDTRLSYAQLSEEVNAIAKVLEVHLRNAHNHNRDGDVLVALCMSPSHRLVATILAVLQVGAAYVALDPSFPASRVDHILQDCAPMLLVLEDGVLAPQSAPYTTTITTSTIQRQMKTQDRNTNSPSVRVCAGEDVAVVLYTSGSTGVPKGVRLPHRALLNRLQWQWHTFPYEEDEVCVFKTALTFVDSLSEVLGPLLSGRTLVVLSKATVARVESLVEVLTLHGVRRLVLVPTLLRALLLHCSRLPPHLRLPHLRLWVCSGEQFPLDLLDNFFHVFTQGQGICNFYGSTEVMGDVTFVHFKSVEDVRLKVVSSSVPIGTVVSNNCVMLSSNIEALALHGTQANGTPSIAGRDALSDGHANGIANGNGVTNGNGVSNGNGVTNANSVANGNGAINGNGIANGNGVTNGKSVTNGSGVAKNSSSSNGHSSPPPRAHNGAAHSSSGPRSGEMLVYGANLALGYVGGAGTDKFLHLLIDGKDELVYRTGDYATLHPSGTLLYDGRTDGQIKIRGHRVDCGEVQQAVQSTEGVKACAVLCHAPGTVQQALVAFYCSDAQEEDYEERLEASLASRLLTYMMPKLVRVPHMPLLVNGKVDRQQLLGDYADSLRDDETLVDVSGAPEDLQHEALALLTVVGRVLGNNTKKGLTLSDKFFRIGGDSLNSVLVVTALGDLGYSLGLTEFLDCDDLEAVARKMAALKSGGERDTSSSSSCSKYTCLPLQEDMEQEVVRLVADSFSSKSDMEVATGAKPEDFFTLLHGIYHDLLLQRLSFVVEDEDGRIVACSLNFDLHAEPPVDVDYPLTWTFDFLEQCESKVRGKLPQSVGEVIHSFMMTTLSELSPKQNIELIKVMEEQNIRLARERQYKAVFTTNTSSATRYVCDDLLDYTVLSETPICSYTAPDGQQPFASVPPDHLAACTVLYV